MSSACKLAREHVSLHLDGELSEFEQVALNGHLSSCARCRAYGASVAEVSAQLRLAPAEQPEFPVVLPHRSRIRVPLRTAQVAATAAVVAVVGFTASGVTPGSERSLSVSAVDTLANQAPNLAVPRGAPTIDVLVERPAAPRPVSGRNQAI